MEDTLYPASLIQEQFWMLDRLQPENPAYNIPSFFFLDGPLDTAALEGAISALCARHEILRTTFVRKGSQLLQCIAAGPSFSWQQVDLSGFVKEEQERELHSQVSRECRKHFDLEAGPLLRATLFRLSDQRHALLLVMHHIVTDLRSKEIFAEELSTAYAALLEGKEPAWKAPARPYRDFTGCSGWQRPSSQREKVMAYWRENLKNVSGRLSLPLDYLREPVWSVQGANLPFSFSRQQVDGLRDFSAAYKTDIFLVLLAAWFVLFFRYSAQKCIVVGVPFTNRRGEGDKDVMGCCVNILPVALNISGHNNFLDVLRKLRRTMLLAHRHQEVPYSLIQTS